MSRPPLLKKTTGTTSGDLRASALSAHSKAQDVWGQKKAAGANDVLDTIEPEKVEGYALDYAIRKFWEIQRQGDDTAKCLVDAETTKKLRSIVVDILAEHQKSLTSEHTFEIQDPEVVEQREKEKRERAIIEMKERQARREAIEKEKQEREAKMLAQKEEEEKQVVSTETEETKEEKKEKRSKRRRKPKDESSREKRRLKRSSKKPDSVPEGENVSGEKKKRTRKKRTKTKEEGKETEEKKTERRKKRRKKKKIAESAPNGIIQPTTKVENTEKTEKIEKTENTENTETPKPQGTDSAAGTARNRRRTVGTGPRGPPMLKRDGEVTKDDTIPKISVTKMLVDLSSLHKILEDKIEQEFSSPPKPSELEKQFLDFYHLSVRGPRASNEDEYCVIENVNDWLNLPENYDKYSYFGIYDGHSGKYTSLYTRSQLHCNLFSHPQFPSDEAFCDAFMETDRCVNEFQHRHTFSCGTTALSVCIRNNNELIVGNVGDCRGFLCRDGKPFEIAVPHNLTREDERKRIESLGGAVVCFGTWRVNGILAVSRSIGDYNLRSLVTAEPEITRIQLQPTDEFLIVASDGLWDGINGEEMIEIVKKTVAEHGRQAVCQVLCNTGIEKETNDNVTVVALFFNHEMKD